MRRLLGFILLAGMAQTVGAQRLLNLDSCRAMALRNNKQMSISRVKQEIAANVRKSARTKYLPHISALGGYEYTSKEVSILNDDQKEALNSMGSNLKNGIVSSVGPYAQILPAALQQRLGTDLTNLASFLDLGGQNIVNAFRTDTRNLWAGAILLTQPVFMGGAIVAMNKLADAGEELAANSAEAKRQATLYHIDQAYWQVVSLRHKQKLAQGYLDLVKKLDGDVQKMIKEGVATRSDGLSVSVKVNEAEMAMLKVSDGLTLSKMLLCQLCGIPVDEQIVLAEEETDNLETVEVTPQADFQQAVENRPELKMLQNMVDMGKQTTNILKAGNLPQVLLTGGYMVSNPNVFNGFEKKFAGVWNVGVLVRVPIWNWGDVAYKVRAAKGATTIATLQKEEAREKIELQVNQSAFQVSEANKKLEMAKASIERANENLRTANLGFSEGVISVAEDRCRNRCQTQPGEPAEGPWHITIITIMSAKTQHNNILLAIIGFSAVVAVVALIGFFALGRDPELIQGQVEVSEYRVSSKVPGRILEIRVKEGDYVKVGDTLAILDAPEVRAKMEQARSAENAAAAQEEMARNGARQEQIQGAFQLMQQAKAGLEIAEKSYQRIQRLFDEGVMSAQKRDEVYANYKAMEAQYKAAESQYEMAKNGARYEDKKAAAALVGRAKGAVNEVNSYIHETVQIAQMEGEVTDIYPKVGELVGTGSPIMTIAVMSDLWGTFNVREDQLNGLEIGKTFTAFVPAFNKNVEMKVYYMKDQGSFAVWKATKANGQYDLKTFEVKARPTEKFDGLRPGMSLIVK